MYSKTETIRLINELAPFFIEVWGLKKYNIKFHVFHYKAKSTPKWAFYGRPCYGWSSVNKRTATIVIFYNRQRGKWDTVGTIVHELLHIKLWDLMQAKTKKKAYQLEEKFVQDMEKTLTTLFKSFKLKDKSSLFVESSK